MNRHLKLIWDFKGETGLETAKHHCIHLKEYALEQELDFLEINHQIINEFHSTAFIAIHEKDLLSYRDALKPHRGELYIP